MADRGPVKIRNARIDDLISLYKNTYKKLAQEIISASEAGKIQKARVMARINSELETLGIDVNEWVKQEIPQYYLDGANLAVTDLRALGIDVSKTTNFAVINREAINALLEETSLNFANSITAISKNASRLVGESLKQQLVYIIAEGKLTGETRKLISSQIEQTLKKEGLTALTDKAGKSWSFENYARMLARTKGVEARNQGLTNRMLAAGYDLVQVSTHRSDHEACAYWEGRILSMTGKTEGYPTLADAKAGGLFHPNCEHAINVFNPELAKITNAYDNPYNYKAAASSKRDIPDAKPKPKPQAKQAATPSTERLQATVYHGEGNFIVPAGNSQFGEAYYVSRLKAEAARYGKITEHQLSVPRNQVLRIKDNEQYNKLVQEVVSTYPGENPQKAIPKYITSKGYKAVELSTDYDERDVLAIFNKDILTAAGGKRPYDALQKQIEQARNAGNIAEAKKLAQKLPEDLRVGMGLDPTKAGKRKVVRDPVTGKIKIVPV